MSLWGSVIGGLVGFTMLGPLGALVGGVIGSKISGNTSFTRRKPNNLDKQVAFFAALFACLAKLAKADGRVREEEVIKVDHFIKEKYSSI